MKAEDIAPMLIAAMPADARQALLKRILRLRRRLYPFSINGHTALIPRKKAIELLRQSIDESSLPVPQKPAAGGSHL